MTETTKNESTENQEYDDESTPPVAQVLEIHNPTHRGTVIRNTKGGGNHGNVGK